MAALDAEWSRTPFKEAAKARKAGRKPSEEDGRTMPPGSSFFRPFLKTLCAFEHKTDKFSQSVDRYADQWRQFQPKGSPDAKPKKPQFQDCLFRCQGWMPFGHADGLSMALLDDLDAAQTIVERYSDTVEEVTVAFCPHMDSYREDWRQGVGAGVRAPKGLFEAHELWESGNLKQRKDEKKSPILPSTYRTQERRPLMIFSRLRLGAMLALCRALPVQELVYSAMALQLGKAWRCLYDNAPSDRASEPEPLYRAKDLREVSITFLDLQEEEEVGLLICGTNLTVCAALVAAAQNLTIKRLTECQAGMSGRAQNVFEARFFKDLARYAGKKNVAKGGGAFVKHVEDNHVFRWLRSTAAVAWQVMAEAQGVAWQVSPTSKLAAVSGFLAVESGLGILPGHQAQVETILNKILLSPKDGRTAEGSRLHALGAEDMTVRWTAPSRGVEPSAPPRAPRLIATKALIERFSDFLTALQDKAPGMDGHKRQLQRHVTGWSSRVSLPVPSDCEFENEADWFHPKVGHHHPSLVQEALGNVSTRDQFQKWTEEIRHVTRALGLPMFLRRSLMFLYENFLNILANPHLFDVVLDFLDVVATLKTALTGNLWNEYVAAPQTPAAPRSNPYTARVDPGVVSDLAVLLDALDNAFEMRLRRVFPELPLRDWSLDFRSSLHQTILGSQAVLKCALAVYRKDVIGLDDAKNNQGFSKTTHQRNSLGVLLHLGFNPGMEVQSLVNLSSQGGQNDGDEINRARLAVFRADFPHLAHIPGYVEVYHEAFHLIFEELAALPPEPVAGVVSARQHRAPVITLALGAHEHSAEEGRSEKDHRWRTASEVFVQCMTCVFIFDANVDLMMRDHVMSYATVHFSVRSDLKKAREDFARNFFYAAMARRMIEKLSAAYRQLHTVLGHPSHGSAEPVLAAHVATMAWRDVKPDSLAFTADLFTRWAHDYRELYPDYDWLFSTDEALDHLREVFGQYYAFCARNLADLWNATRLIFSTHVLRILQEADSKRKPVVKPADNVKTIRYSVMAVYERELKAKPAPSQLITAEVIATYLSLQKRADSAISSAWSEVDAANGRYAPVMAFDTAGDPKICLDANLLVRRTLLLYLQKVRAPEFKQGEHYDGPSRYALRRRRPDDRAQKLRNSTPAEVMLRNALENVGAIVLSQKGGKESSEVAYTASETAQIRAGKGLSPLMMDRCFLPPFVFSHQHRRRLLGYQISVLKTVWDIASRNRARRFLVVLDMLQESSSQKKAKSKTASK